MPPRERRVFVCQNFRPEGSKRPSCTSNGKSELLTELQQLVTAAGLGRSVRVEKSGCLDHCEHGPSVVVYPDAVWYGRVQAKDAAAIVQEHFVGGRPVERLRLAPECVDPGTCPHRT